MATDLALEMACDELAILRERLTIAEIQRDFWRQFLIEALGRVREQAVDLERERRDRYRLVDELRRLRAETLTRAA